MKSRANYTVLFLLLASFAFADSGGGDTALQAFQIDGDSVQTEAKLSDTAKSGATAAGSDEKKEGWVERYWSEIN
ncbi:MAG: hypothetical protein JSV44_11165, partial [Candidatus Zixiibacteriota bacterium]